MKQPMTAAQFWGPIIIIALVVVAAWGFRDEMRRDAASANLTDEINAQAGRLAEKAQAAN